ncbi:MAG: hypothetical protein CMJ39_03570 [Phycisphaerae bacterium]|nr:hypothetical protein [Phycisphaerae bacterium]|tara:strand:+ start:881 stop:1147 length:267 start_codon:yes stop_codon:yes gene_type:complete
MDNQTKELSQEDVDRLFEAAAAVFFAVLDCESNLHPGPLLIPAWFCPSVEPPCTCGMDPAVVQEASNFLVRMGIMRVDESGHLRLFSM